MTNIIKEPIELSNGIKGIAYSNLQGLRPDCWLVQLEGTKNCINCPSWNKVGSCGGGISLLEHIYKDIGGISQYAIYLMQELINEQEITMIVAIRKMNEDPTFDSSMKDQLNTAWRKYLEKTDPNPKTQEFKVLSGLLDLEYGGKWYNIIDNNTIKIVGLTGVDMLRHMLDDVDDDIEFLLNVEEGFYTVDNLLQFGNGAASSCGSDEVQELVSSKNFNEEWLKKNLDSDIVLSLAESIFEYGAGRVSVIDEKYNHDDEQAAIDKLKDEYGIEINY